MISFGDLRISVANSGVLVYVKEEVVGRLNPSESLALLQHLEEHWDEFDRALVQVSEPVFGGKAFERKYIDANQTSRLKKHREMP